MILPVVWTEQAREQFYEMHEYIQGSRPVAADRQVELIMRSVDGLSGLPKLGRTGRRSGTRELAAPGSQYVLSYRVMPTMIEILAVVHGARRWPKSFGA